MPRTALPFVPPALRLAAVALPLLLLPAGCGSSSTTATAPAPTRCGLNLTVDGVSFTADGGSGAIHVSVARECAWAAQSDAPWVTLAAASGQGDAVVDFKVAANAASTARTAAISVNDQRRSLSQQGAPCRFELSSTLESVEAAGGDRTVHVSATPDCRWTTQTEASWISVVGGRDGTGSGDVTLRIAAAGGPPRSAVVVIAGEEVRIQQGTGCTYDVRPVSLTSGSGGGTASIEVTTAAGCEWTAHVNQDWTSLPAGRSGRGPSPVPLAIAPNAGPPRSGTAAVAGRTVAIAQAGGCTYALAPQSGSLPPGGGSGVISVTTAPGCPWSAAAGPGWIALGGASGAGPGQVSYTAAANASPARAGTLTVAGIPFPVTQASQCAFTLAPPYHEFDASGGNGNVLVIVSGPCSWTASSPVDWIRMTAGQAGTGNGLVQFVVTPNSGAARKQHLSIAGQEYLVTQTGVVFPDR